MSDTYTIELARRTQSGAEETLRSHTAGSLFDAEMMIESLRESYEQRDGVVWDGEDLNNEGHLNGMSGGVVYTISMVKS